MRCGGCVPVDRQGLTALAMTKDERMESLEYNSVRNRTGMGTNSGSDLTGIGKNFRIFFPLK